MIHKLIEQEFNSGLHALQIVEAKSIREWEEAQEKKKAQS